MSKPVLTLQARKIGSLVDIDNPRITPIMGVYRSGVLAFFSPQAALYLTDQLESGPFTVFVPGLQDHIAGCRVGQQVYIQHRSIEVPEAELKIDLNGAQPWLNTSPPRPAPWSKIATVVHATLRYTLTMTGQQSLALTAVCVLFGDEMPLLEQNPLWAIFGEAMTLLSRSTQLADSNGIGEAASRLIGLGPGATPSGDDILGGYMAALWYTDHHSHLSGQERRAIQRKLLALREKRTNSLSAALLWAAAYGEVGGTLKAAILALISGEILSDKMTKALSNIGHSSGLDGLAGVLVLLYSCSLAAVGEPNLVAIQNSIDLRSI